MLGAGYDTRSVRFLTKNEIDEAWELDVVEVLDSKLVMLDRLKSRRPECGLPNIVSADLNDVKTFRKHLNGIIPGANSNWHTIFLFEGVLMYLKGEIPDQIMSACANHLQEQGQSGSLIFADYLRGLPSDGDFQMAKKRLATLGWNLVDDSWSFQPSFQAKHMGRAVVISSGGAIMDSPSP